MSASAVTILDALDDEHLFAPMFPGPSWRRWRSFLAGLFCLPMDEAALEVYRHHTGRSERPVRPFREAAVICGRRGGKSRVLALIAVYLATFQDYRAFLAPGEQPIVAIIAADRRQARICLRYIIGLLREVPLLAPLIAEERSESVELISA